MNKKIKIKTRGMTCSSCEVLIGSGIKKLDGVNSVKVDYVSETAVIEFDETKTSMQEIFKAVEKAGYEPGLVSEDAGELGEMSAGLSAGSSGKQELAALKQKFLNEEISEEDYLTKKNEIKLEQIKKLFITGEISDEEYISGKKEISAQTSHASNEVQKPKEPVDRGDKNYHHQNHQQRRYEQKHNKQKNFEEKSVKLAEPYTKPWYAHASFYAVGIIVILLGLYLIISGPVVPKYPELSASSGLWIVFIIGLMTGFHCIGMCGPMVLSYSTNLGLNSGEEKKSRWDGIKPHLMYTGSKAMSYAILGAIAGLVGSLFFISDGLRSGLMIFAGIFMIIFGLNMLNLIPALRKIRFGMPKFLQNIFYGTSGKSHKSKSPMLIGFLNGLMPCGPLQAMLIFAATTGSWMKGALTMFVFGLGTIPLMLLFGIFATSISHNFSKKILKASAIIIIVIGLVTVNRALLISGSPYAIGSGSYKLPAEQNNQNNQKVVEPAKQVQPIELSMKIGYNGYEPNVLNAKKGVPLRISVTDVVGGCYSTVVFPDFGVQKYIPKGKTEVIEFTPNKAGKFQFNCPMRMAVGTLIVEE